MTPQFLSQHFNISPESLDKVGVLDAAIGIDTKLFLDPFLLDKIEIPEFINSRDKVLQHFEKVITLLVASESEGDIAWRQAVKMMTFPETPGASIGYGMNSEYGSAVGEELARRITKTAKEIINMGVKNPEIFELLGLFEEDFGADRLSDVIISIIKDDIYQFTNRVCNELKIPTDFELQVDEKLFKLPLSPNKKRPILFLPKELLRNLPVALDREGIAAVAALNRNLRTKLNTLIGRSWKDKMKKKELRQVILSDEKFMQQLVQVYKDSDAKPYDFVKDPLGIKSWAISGKEIATTSPLPLSLNENPSMDEVQELVEKIINKFKSLIEAKGLNKELFYKKGSQYKVRPEQAAQLLFFMISDCYCEANNIDVSREPNAGRGPVDFKFSKGYTRKVLVEIKLSSHRRLIHGFTKQLPTYQQSEDALRGIYLILRVTQEINQIKELKKIAEAESKNGKKIPKIIVIDARIRPSASKL